MIKLRADLPFERDQSTRFLPWIVALMVFLGALALAAAIFVHSAVASLDNDLTGRVTVQIPNSEATPETVLQIVSMLRATPGIVAADTLSPAAGRALIEPWLGAQTEQLDLPLPAIINVSLANKAQLDIRALAQKLSQAAPGIIVDDHRVWMSGLLDLARAFQLTSLLVLLLIGLTAVATVIFVTRSGLAVHAAIIELLHLMGARDSYIAGQFQMQAMVLCIRGGLFGSIAAAAVLIMLASAAKGIDSAFLPPLSLSILQWLALAAVPLGAIAIAVWTARVTVLRTLAKLP